MFLIWFWSGNLYCNVEALFIPLPPSPQRNSTYLYIPGVYIGGILATMNAFGLYILPLAHTMLLHPGMHGGRTVPFLLH